MFRPRDKKRHRCHNRVTLHNYYRDFANDYKYKPEFALEFCLVLFDKAKGLNFKNSNDNKTLEAALRYKLCQPRNYKA